MTVEEATIKCFKVLDLKSIKMHFQDNRKLQPILIILLWDFHTNVSHSNSCLIMLKPDAFLDLMLHL